MCDSQNPSVDRVHKVFVGQAPIVCLLVSVGQVLWDPPELREEEVSISSGFCLLQTHRQKSDLK